MIAPSTLEQLEFNNLPLFQKLIERNFSQNTVLNKILDNSIILCLYGIHIVFILNTMIPGWVNAQGIETVEKHLLLAKGRRWSLQ